MVGLKKAGRVFLGQTAWKVLALLALVVGFVGVPSGAFASESDLILPSLDATSFTILGKAVGGRTLLQFGLVVCILGGLFGIWQAFRMRALPAHKAMLEVSELIYSTCKTYLFTQARLLFLLEILIGIIIFVYFKVASHMDTATVLIILMWSVIGILGSFAVAWFGMRINTYANSRAAFSSLRGKPLPVLRIPLQAGMSIGMLLISVELVLMLIILLYISPQHAGPCFLGFAIGESLGASVLRICGGIFTKIADIGSDLMKIVFKIKEDDARNPGVIADCVGDNAGDSVGPTADGFETYGVTGVALITFIALAMKSAPDLQATLLVWIFVMRIMMIVTSLLSYKINDMMTVGRYANATKMDFEKPLHELVVLTSGISIVMTYGVSYLLLGNLAGEQSGLWWQLSTIISCGTVAGALIPVLTMAFTSLKSKHVTEIVDSTREGGASLTILSGLVAGNFSAFWMGLAIAGLMGAAYFIGTFIPGHLMSDFQAVFAFGLVAFGFLGMGPVTIAVDSYGPVTDNAQSIYELSTIESMPNIKQEISKDFGFEPDFNSSKDFLEENDGAGNTFKATAKPVLIGTAVVGATTMIFSLILMLTGGKTELLKNLSITDPHIILGLICGGAVVYWFTGASMQAVTTGAYRAVEFIKRNIKLDVEGTKASIADSQKVVAICTQYAQTGMINIFCVIFFLALGFAFIQPYFFVAYLVSIAVFGLFQAIFMANAGGAWDNAKKLVEISLKEKGSALHDATVVGDTVGDPFKDTSSVALNPIIKFTTLFGILAVELAVKLENKALVHGLAVAFCLIGLFFVYRSFYNMRIKSGG
ncbi:MAG: sodium-translocating pyrophosphatase [Candidatus Sumerlaeaceae bacterium]|nr:sodium-translocating pyrophosphatase [Candidatus Sumerlaeaceae bacterium]